MPLPELVKAIIHLKWAVDDNFDSSINAINDKLCILTQVFQFGLGLRIGEVLRLPQNPLIKMDGETFCLVWTEKGSMPMAPYVPLILPGALTLPCWVNFPQFGVSLIYLCNYTGFFRE